MNSILDGKNGLVIFTADTSDPEGQYRANRYLKANDMAIALFEIRHNMLRDIDHQLEAGGDVDVIELVNEKLNDYFEEFGINIEELTY